MQPLPGWIDFPVVSPEGIPTNLFLIGIISLLLMLIPTLIFLLADLFQSSVPKERLKEETVEKWPPEGSEESEEAELVTPAKEA